MVFSRKSHKISSAIEQAEEARIKQVVNQYERKTLVLKQTITGMF